MLLKAESYWNSQERLLHPRESQNRRPAPQSFGSAIIHPAVFPQYPVRRVEETIRYHLGPEPRPAGFPYGPPGGYGKASTVPACRPSANLSEERNKGRRRAGLARLNLRSRRARGREGASRKAGDKAHSLNWESTPAESLTLCLGSRSFRLTLSD
jgi:hypothetical protein